MRTANAFRTGRRNAPGRRLLAGLVLLAGTAPAAALAQGPAAAGAGLDGAALYHDYCSVCHGDKGDGNSRVKGSMVPPPRDFTSPQAAGELTRERMLASTRDGRPGTGMPAWANQLTSNQIAAVVDYVREAFMLPAARHDPDRARLIYAEYCSVCHGDKGNGQSRATGSLVPPPRDFTTTRAARELTRDRMVFSVTYGRANTAMPPWETQLSKADIEAVVDYIRRTFMPAQALAEAARPAAEHADHGGHDHQHAAPSDVVAFMAQPMPKGLAGSAAWGKTFYDDYCADCHGVKGDGNGPRAYFILPRPRDFQHPAARANLNRPHLYEVIDKGSVGTEMAAWGKVLTDLEIASVAEYVFAAFIRPADQGAEAAAPAMSMPAAGQPGGAEHHDHSTHAH